MNDALPAATAGHSSYKCASCGAAQTLAPGAEALACAHCGAVTPIAPIARPIVEHDFAQARARVHRGPAGGLARGAREVQCKNCGARSVTTLQARRCPFCDEPLVVELAPSADTVLPDAVVPFAIAKDAAGGAYQGWLRSRWFAPGDLTKRAKRDGLDGIYVPYWTYDSDSFTQYTGARGEHYYVTEHYTDSQNRRRTRQVRKTRWYSAHGTVSVRFNDVQVCASKGLPRNRMAQLEPWDLGGLRPFDGAYLAGFVAERYQVDLEEGWGLAQELMQGRITSAVRADIGGDEQRIHSMQVHHRGVTFKHVLLPVWVSSFRYREKVYRVVVNAQTGEVAGDRPWSVPKIVLFALAIAAVIAAIVWAIMAAREPAPPPAPPPSPPIEVPGIEAGAPRPAVPPVDIGLEPVAPSPDAPAAAPAPAVTPPGVPARPRDRVRERRPRPRSEPR